MLTHVGNSAIWKFLKIYNNSWSFRTLLHIWREAIIIPISFDTMHKWKPHIANPRGRLDKSWQVCIRWLGQHGGLMSRNPRQATREHRQQLPKATYWAWMKLKKTDTTHYHRSHEVDHEGTPKSSHVSMSAYQTITWKAIYKATQITDWRVVA